MINDAPQLEGTGLSVQDIQSNPSFLARPSRPRNPVAEVEALARIARVFVGNPQVLLQELVDSAVSLCRAHSAGITLEQKPVEGEVVYHWVATSGHYAKFLNATLPEFPSACGVCISRGRPQLFAASQEFFDKMKVEADIVTDGILIPWSVDGARGTLWIMAHDEKTLFDATDVRLAQVLADFAALGVRQRLQEEKLIEQARLASAAAMAHELAHHINNPLQSLANCIYLVEHNVSPADSAALHQDMRENLDRLTTLTNEILTLPIRSR